AVLLRGLRSTGTRTSRAIRARTSATALSRSCWLPLPQRRLSSTGRRTARRSSLAFPATLLLRRPRATPYRLPTSSTQTPTPATTTARLLPRGARHVSLTIHSTMIPATTIRATTTTMASSTSSSSSRAMETTTHSSSTTAAAVT
ncbi:hypothetical protein H4S06_004347, partial [Coemansia sp. BCRC 34490]